MGSYGILRFCNNSDCAATYGSVMLWRIGPSNTLAPAEHSRRSKHGYSIRRSPWSTFPKFIRIRRLEKTSTQFDANITIALASLTLLGPSGRGKTTIPAHDRGFESPG